MGIGTNDMSTKQNDETQSRWYMVNKDGMATLCADQADAEQEAKNAQEVWPHMGPHRAVRLAEVGDAGFTAADMATAAAQGFRDGQAAEIAAMRAGGEPVAEMVPYHTPSGKRVAVISRFQHLPIGTKLYTHPKPAAQAQDAEQWTSDDCREFCAIGRAINRAAGHLPDHARVRIDLENGAGTAYWLDNASGAWRHIDSGDLFSTQIDAATDAAIAAKQGGAA